MEVVFPEFSSSKRRTFKPNVVTVSKLAPPPIYYLIIGIKSLTKIGSILDFATYNLTLDSITLTMQAFGSLIDPKELHTVLNGHLEPRSMLETTHHAVHILDASYENVDLLSILNESFKSLQTNVTIYYGCCSYGEVLFDGTLVDW